MGFHEFLPTLGMAPGTITSVGTYNPYTVVYDPVNHLMWTGSYSGSSWAIIAYNCNTFTQVYLIPLAFDAAGGICYDSIQQRVWIGSSGSSKAAGINTSNGTIAYTVSTSYTDGMAFDATNNVIWVGSPSASAMYRIAGASGAVTYISLPGYTTAGIEGTIYCPTTNQVYFGANYQSLYKMNAATNVVSSFRALQPSGSQLVTDMYYDALNNVIWYSSYGGNLITINPSTGAILATYNPTNSSYPEGFAQDASGNLWFGNMTNYVLKISSTTGALLASYKIGAYSSYGAFDPINNRYWAACRLIPLKVIQA